MANLAFHKLLPPIVILIVGIIFQQHFLTTLPSLQTILAELPYLVFLLTALLAIQFNQSRLVLIVLLLCGAYTMTQFSLTGSLLNPTARLLLFCVSCIAIAVISWLQDRGIWTVYSAKRLAVLSAIVLATILISNYFDIQINLFFNHYQIALPQNVPLQLPQSLLLITLLSFTLSLYRFVRHQSSVNGAIAIAFPGYFVAENWLHVEAFHSICFMVIGLSFCVAILLDSYHMAYRDELTGIPARRALNQLSLGLGKKYVVAMMDVDHFKKFNDTHGHDVGDQVLKMVAGKINQISGGGKAYRYGGEEFTVVFPRKNLADAKHHLEIIREAIANYQMKIRDDKSRRNNTKKQRNLEQPSNNTVSVTISIGVAERTEHLKNFEQIMKAADEALYRAKNAGRNCLSE